jgi:DNA-binding CsgD family transcriptional regulator
MRDRHFILLALVIQAACAFFFITDILSSYIGFHSSPISWRLREVIEIGAALGLLLGFVLGAVALRRSHRRRITAEERLRRASAAFMEVVSDSFTDWGLTPAERDVALFCVKGMSTSQIAALRNTSEGTVKAQTNAIYRKAGVSGRSQLLSLFIEELMDDGSRASAPSPEPEAADAAAPIASAG